MKHSFFTIFLFVTIITRVEAQSGNTCADAIRLCSKDSFTINDMSGFNTSGTQPSCFGGFTVQRDVWLKVTIGSSGTFEFRGNPLQADEFDWAVYDITSGCNGTQLVCNYNYASSTGADFGMQGASGGEFSTPINVTAGQVLAILIDNSDGVGGFELTLGGTFTIDSPVADFIVPEKGCTVPFTFDITNTSIGASSYSWDFGDGNTSTSANPGTHTYTTEDIFTISLTAFGSDCSSNTSKIVEVTNTPVDPPTGSSSQTFCSDATVEDLSVTGSEIKWYDASTSGNFLPSTTILINSTNYYASQTVDGCESANRFEVTTTVNPTPSNDVTQIGNTLTATETGVSYQWIDCDNGNTEISGEINQSFTPNISGNYAVILTEGSCSNTSSCYVVNIVSVLESKQLISAIYPNPVKDEITIALNSKMLVNPKIEIYSLEGKIVYSEKLKVNNEKTTFRVNHLSKGVYLIKLLDNNQEISSDKVVVE